MELLINKEAFNELPKDLQAIVLNAAKVANADMLNEYTTRNNDALNQLINDHKVQIRRFPDDMLRQLKVEADNVAKELSQKDALTKRTYESFMKYRDQARAWHKFSEQAYYEARSL